MSNYISKYDYLLINKRENFHSTIREDLYLEFQILAKRYREPMTKILDLLIIDLLSTPESQEQLKIKLHNYR